MKRTVLLCVVACVVILLVSCMTTSCVGTTSSAGGIKRYSVILHVKTDELSGCFRLYHADRIERGAEVAELFLKPHSTGELKFSPGTYVLLDAQGEVWLSDEEAFGPQGYYGRSVEFRFETGEYEIVTSTTTGHFDSISQSGFLL